MVGVAGVAAHGDAGQFAHKVVFQSGADDLLGIVQILGADKADHGVDQKGLIPLGKAVAPGLHGHLIPAVVGLAGQLGALSGLKIHDVGAVGVAVAQSKLARFLDGGGVEAKGLVALLRPGDGLEDHVGGRALADGLHLCGHMGQHAGLGGNFPAVADLVEALQHPGDAFHAVVHRVEAQHGVADAVGQALQQGSHDAVRVIGGVVGLQPGRQGAGQADGGVAVCRDRDFLGRVNQVHVAHELGHGGNHLGSQTPADAPDGGGVVFFVQQPLPQLGHRPVADLGVNFLVDIVLNDAGDLVGLVRHGGVVAQVGQRQIGHHHLGSHPLGSIFGGKPGQRIARLFLVGFCHNGANVRELIDLPQQFGF